MYYAHFGLNQAPFRITPNTEFFFAGGNRGAILEALIYAVTHGEGIIKVTGEVGSGKTMLCNMLQSRLPAQVETVYIANPSVTPEEILHAVAFELQLSVPRDAGRLELMQALHTYLLDRYAQNKQVVVFIEESQTAPLATLEEIRLLSNLETQQHKLLQIVLFGQPELDANLRQPSIRQLRERIAHSFSLAPLGADDIGQYLMFRLRAAGYRGPDLFNPAVVRLIAKASGGLTRRVNLIADKTLLAAFSENTHTIGLDHVQAAVRDSEFAREDPHRITRSLGLGASLLAIGAGLGAILYAGYQAHFAVPAAAPLPPASRASGAATEAVAATRPEATAPAPAAPAVVHETSAGAAPPAVRATDGPAAAPAVAKPVTVANAPKAPATATVAAPSANVAAAAPAAPRQKPPAAARETLQQRLDATEQWLQRSAPAVYSIQLLGADDPEQLKRHLNTISKFVEINHLFVYRTVARQKPYLTVLYGSFENRREAQEALSKLPEQLRAYRPYLRTVQGIRAEIGQQPSS